MASDPLNEAIERLEAELSSVRDDLKAILPLLDLTGDERRALEGAEAGQWASILAGTRPAIQGVLWDRHGQEWRLVEGGWILGPGDTNPWPLEQVEFEYGPITWERPNGAYSNWDD